jgi:hypothetical protein
MLDKDKLILIVYFGLYGIELKSRAYTEMINCREVLRSYFDDSVKILVLPDRSSESIKVETINPQLLSDEDYREKVMPIIEKAEKVIKEFKNE